MVGNEYWGYVVIRREEGKFCVVGNEYWGYVVIRRERGNVVWWEMNIGVML